MAQNGPMTAGTKNDTRPFALMLAILLALSGAVFIPFYIHYYDVGVYNSDYPQLTAVNALVPLVLFMVLLVVALLNPLLKYVLPIAKLRRRELLVIMAVWLLSATICARQLGMRMLTQAGVTYGRGVSHRTIDKVGLREDYLNSELFLPSEDATQYYYGVSPDGRSWVLPLPRSPKLSRTDFADLVGLAKRLTEPEDPLSEHLAAVLKPETRDGLAAIVRKADGLGAPLVKELNAVVASGESLYDPQRFQEVDLGEEVKALLETAPKGDDLAGLNRRIIERVYPRLIVRASSDDVIRFSPEDIRSASRLVRMLYAGGDPVARHLRERFSEASGKLFADYAAEADTVAPQLARDLNAAIAQPLPPEVAAISEEGKPAVGLSDATRAALARNPEGKELLAANRTALEEAYGGEIAPQPFVVPWTKWFNPRNWGLPGSYWLALIAAFTIFSMSLVRAMHRQWSQHELLTYPIASVADSLIGVKRGRLLPEIFYDRIFWAGFGVIAFIYLMAGLHAWFPQMVYVKLGWNHTGLIKEFYFLSKYCGREAYAFFRGWLYTFMVAIAVLLPTEISLSCWLGWALMVFGTGFYFLLTGETITNNETGYIQTGMQVSMGLVVLFIGRREYWNVMRTALFTRKAEDEGMRRAASAARMFVISGLAFWWLLQVAGMDWLISLVMVGTFGLLVLLIARMTAEIGMPWLVNFRGLGSMGPLHLLGAAVMGPKGLAVAAAMMIGMDHFTTNSVAAQETTISKLRERGRTFFHGGGLTVIIVAGIALTLVSMTFFNVWENYSFGARNEGRVINGIATDVREAAGEINRLSVEGRLEEVSEGSGFARFNHYQYDKKFMRFCMLGAAIILACAVMRLRFNWWPFHPLPLLFFNTWAMSRMAYPIMVGWLIKMAILRVWGGKTFARSKSFWYGAIIGQVFVVCFWMVVSLIYYLVTDTIPVRFNSFY